MSLSTSPAEPAQTPSRGRPPSITRDRIADAGIAIGMSEMTVTGVAAKLGVSHMGLYKHVKGLEELRALVAEAAFLRWEFPDPQSAEGQPLEAYLNDFAASIWRLVAGHPGIAPWLLRGELITPPMLQKIVAHQEELARLRGLTFAQSRWLMLTIGFHCVAVADTVLPRQVTILPEGKNPIDPEHREGIRALIVGALAILDQITSFPYPVAETGKYAGAPPEKG